MRPIFINGNILSGEISGIPRYTYECISEMDNILSHVPSVQNKYKSLELYLAYSAEKNMRLPKLDYIKLEPMVCRDKRFNSDILRKHINERNGISCNLSNGVCYNKNGVVCVHDVRAMQFKNYDSAKKRLEMQMLKYSTKIMNSTIVTVSYFQKEKIAQLFGVNRNRIFVIPNGWEHINKIEADNGIFERYPEIKKGDYFYSLGSVAKHKNYKWIHETAKRNPEKQFVVAGNILKNTWGIDEKEYLLPNVRFVGYVSDEENKALMMECKAFLHPSKYEGFGIPPLEALALDKKIIISNATCLPEIYKESAVYFDPNDYKVDLDELLLIPTHGTSEVLEEYSWRKSGMKWLDLLYKVARGV